jgi:hypothetical protein
MRCANARTTRSKESWNRYLPEDVWNAMCQHLQYMEKLGILPGNTISWTRNPLSEWDFSGNNQLIDKESTQGRRFHRELTAYLRGFSPVRSKCAENPSKGNNSRISSSKSYILTMPCVAWLISDRLLKGTLSRDFRPSVFFINQYPWAP